MKRCKVKEFDIGDEFIYLDKQCVIEDIVYSSLYGDWLIEFSSDIDDYDKAEEDLFDDGDAVGEMEGEVFPDEGGDIEKDDDQME